jgi:hypothetical protein
VAEYSEVGPFEKHVFVGKVICGFQGRQINHLRVPRKKGYWAEGEGLCGPINVTCLCRVITEREADDVVTAECATPRLFFVTGGFFHGLRVGFEAQLGQARAGELAVEDGDIA